MGSIHTTQSSLLMGTMPTSTSLSLKYKCLLKDTTIYNWPKLPVADAATLKAERPTPRKFEKINHMQQMESMRHIRVRPLWGSRRLINRRYIYVRRFLKFKGISTNPEISKARASRGTTAKTLQRRDGVTPTPLHTTTWTNLCQLP